MADRRAIASLLLLLASCGGGALSRGESQFEDGRYAEAKQTLSSIEQESRGWDDAKRAEYALFRGLTMTALGDRASASSWLHEAKAIEDAHPHSLSDENARRLKVAVEANEAQ